MDDLMSETKKIIYDKKLFELLLEKIDDNDLILKDFIKNKIKEL